MEHLKHRRPPIPYSGDGWFDPLEAAVRFQVRAFIETMVEAELLAALGGRDRYHDARVRPRAIETATGIGSLSGPSVNAPTEGFAAARPADRGERR